MSHTGKPPTNGTAVWDGSKWVTRIVGGANGIATLDGTGKLPVGQLPSGAGGQTTSFLVRPGASPSANRYATWAAAHSALAAVFGMRTVAFDDGDTSPIALDAGTFPLDGQVELVGVPRNAPDANTVSGGPVITLGAGVILTNPLALRDLQLSASGHSVAPIQLGSAGPPTNNGSLHIERCHFTNSSTTIPIIEIGAGSGTNIYFHGRQEVISGLLLDIPASVDVNLFLDGETVIPDDCINGAAGANLNVFIPPGAEFGLQPNFSGTLTVTNRLDVWVTKDDVGGGIRSRLDFTGAGVTVTDDSGNDKIVVSIPGGSGGYATIEDEGSALTQRTTANFVGAGVTAADSGGKTVVTIPGDIVVQEEGSSVGTRRTLNFIGANVTAVDNPGQSRVDVTVTGGGGGYATIEDEGIALTQRTTVNFTGDGVSAADVGGKTVVTISAGALGSAAPSRMPIDASTVLLYQFDDTTSGTAITNYGSAGSGGNATISLGSGTVVVRNAIGLQFPRAMKLADAGNGRTTLAHAAITWPSSAFTVWCSFVPTDRIGINGISTIFFKQSDNSYTTPFKQLTVEWDNASGLVFTVRTSGGVGTITVPGIAADFPLNEPMMVGLTLSGGVVTAYVNGVPVGSASPGGNFSAGTGPLVFGNYDDGGNGAEERIGGLYHEFGLATTAFTSAWFEEAYRRFTGRVAITAAGQDYSANRMPIDASAILAYHFNDTTTGSTIPNLGSTGSAGDATVSVGSGTIVTRNALGLQYPRAMKIADAGDGRVQVEHAAITWPSSALTAYCLFVPTSRVGVNGKSRIFYKQTADNAFSSPFTNLSVEWDVASGLVYRMVTSGGTGTITVPGISSDFPLDEPAMVALTLSGGVVTAYFNGVSVGTASPTGNFTAGAGPLVFGNYDDGTNGGQERIGGLYHEFGLLTSAMTAPWFSEMWKRYSGRIGVGTSITRIRNVRAVTTSVTLSSEDDVVAVGTLGAPITLTLPASPTIGQTHTIKDTLGGAATNNITLSGNGANIDGAATFVINTNYSSIPVCFTGTRWSVL